MDEQWTGEFNPSAYAKARETLEADRTRATEAVRVELAKRGRIVAIVAFAWMLFSVVVGFVNSELLLVAEIGWVAIVAVAVFYLFPAITASGNIDELFKQYADQLNKLENAQVPLPTPENMEGLVEILNATALPDERSRNS